ncbi:MAG: hypothetical protein RLZZ136_234, partial [Pseudomonadota bacterium]|jgi:16S rRNA (cytosine967-C5)-methyltransferase
VRELAYAAIRACGPVPENGRAALLRLADSDPALAALFDGVRHAPAVITPDEPRAMGGVAPVWLEQALAASGITDGEALALLSRAPLDVRINRLKAGTLDLPEPGEPSLAPDGLRYAAGTALEQWPAYQTGGIEVQDAGSQIACIAVGARPGDRVIDLCAGAGGKSLSLAAAMDDRGDILACDIDRDRLSRLQPRAERAGATIIHTRLLNPEKELDALADWQGQADAVLVDAPCSGTGTWRRNPEARWRLTPAALARLVAVQARLLDIAAKLVKPGGRLTYVTCSLLDQEGADQAAAFLKRNPTWQLDLPQLPAGRRHGQGLRLTPAHDATDGFFIARFVLP